ncbi:MAG: tetratricopeptide repeat protein [Myxococcales bacterium]
MRRIFLALFTAILFLSSFPLGAEAEDTQDDEARALFEAGLVAYDSQRFESALMYFRRSLALSGRAKLHYNVGLALERLGRAEEAIDSYSLYLQAIPDAANRLEVEGRIGSLEKWVPESKPGAVPEAVQSPPTEVVQPPASEQAPTAATQGPTRRRRTGLALVASGGALLAAGGVFVGLALRAQHEVEAAPQGGYWQHVASDNDRALTFSVVGFSLLGTGVVSAVLGGGLWFRNRHITVDVALAPRAFCLQGRF